jgi:hypothetical protein
MPSPDHHPRAFHYPHRPFLPNAFRAISFQDSWCPVFERSHTVSWIGIEDKLSLWPSHCREAALIGRFVA